MKQILSILTLAICTMTLSGCFDVPSESQVLLKTPTLPDTPFDYVAAVSEIPPDVNFSTGFTNFPFSDIVEADFVNSNPQFDGPFGVDFFPGGGVPNMLVTDDGATLGRVLFYDQRLSLNNTVSCGSCHHQSKGFADFDAASIGFEGKRTPRNSMALANPGLNNNLFWDSRVQNTHDLILEPIQNHIEMGMVDLDFMVEKILKTDYYPPLFAEAFGDPGVSKERISNAMSQFLNSMISFNSKFDRERHNEFAGFTATEKLGMELFNSKRLDCNGCHAGLKFAAADAPFDEYGGVEGGLEIRGTANIGLDFVYDDNGRHEGQFKIPSLRNVALSAPYMHDGRFADLEAVIDHYDQQIKPHQNLDDRFLENGQTKKLNLTSFEKQALIAFLGTLTDQEYIAAERFSNPF